MRTLPVLAVVWLVLAGCSGSAPPSRNDGATDTARTEGSVAEFAGDAPRDTGAADGPTGADATADGAAGSDGAATDAPASLDVVRPDGPPAANATCAAALTLGPTTSSAHGQLDFGGTPAPACGGGSTPALYYAVEVPAGHRLTAVATSTAGSRYWQPSLKALTTCDAKTCLARSNAAAGGGFRLDWINNGGATAQVLVEVSANVPVTGAEFDLAVTLVDVNVSCTRPVAVQDGSTFANLDLTGLPPSANTTCSLAREPALYFVTTVLPQQELTVTTKTPNGGPAPVSVALRTACNDTCEPSSSFFPANTTNMTKKPQTVLIEVTSPSRMSGLFDLHVSLPAAPSHVTVTATSPLVTTEAGGKATFQVVLESQPAASVTVNLTSDRPAEGTVSPATLVFDATNWSAPHVVTVTGVDDQVGDGARRYSIVTAPAVSADPLYSGLDAEDVPITNLDDEPALIVEGGDDVVTSEDGMPATFTIRLSAAPTGAVDVPLASSDTGEGTVSPASLRFTAATWNVPQTVTVTGADDTMPDGPQEYTIALGPLVSDDTRYGGQTASAVVAHNKDDDFTAGTTTIQFPGDVCGIASTPNAFPAAIDGLGRIYAVFSCESQLFFFRSDDGGKTVSVPTALPFARHADGGFALAAARDGVVYLAYSERGGGLEVARSRDAGKSWNSHALLPAMPDLVRIGVARDTVAVVGDNPVPEGGFDGTVVLRSLDAGWSYEAPVIIPGQGQMMALGMGVDGKRLSLIDDFQSLFGSGDAGKTWRTLGTVDAEGDGEHCCFVFGSTSVFAIAEGTVSVTSLADAKNLGRFGGPAGAALAATIDDLEIITIVGEGPGGMLGTRFGSNHTLATAKLDFPKPFFARALTLSRHATAIVSIEGANVRFTRALW